MMDSGQIFLQNAYFFLLVIILSSIFSNVCLASYFAESKTTLRSDGLRHRFIRSLTPVPETSKDARRGPYLKIVGGLQNQTMSSGNKATFKCRVDGFPKDDVSFTWYKDHQKLNASNFEPRIKIRNRELSSRLQIFDVYSFDSGLYRCEASNIERRVHSSAYLSVRFNLLPDDTDTAVDTKHLKGKCELYNGEACKEFLQKKYFYMESFENQNDKEANIKAGLENLADLSNNAKSRCFSYTKEAFCYYVFPPCKYSGPEKDAKPKKLCRQDCELLKHDVCRNEFFHQPRNLILSTIVNEANCSVLPVTTRTEMDCTSIGLANVVDRKESCYSDNGKEYRGTISVTVEGNKCQAWPTKMLSQHPELAGGHNFCRNPSGTEDVPWCFVDLEKLVKEKCQVPKCDTGGFSRVLLILVAIGVPVLLVFLAVLLFCCACKRKKSNVEHTKGIQMDNKTLSAKKTKVPELSGNLIQVTGELGDGKYGKVFKAQILSNLHYCPNDPVAVKTLSDRAAAQQVQDFQLEMDTFSVLQHPNVACLKAVVVQAPFRCMIFEHTLGADLQEYLVMHSPQADFAKPSSSVSSHASSCMNNSDFIRMAIQITAGMEYLTSNNFIHRDLAARNVLMFGNMDLKISNLGVVKDSYLSSYYRSPQGGQMLPIRWMAQESMHGWKFSDKSSIWSFGVLLWEMFSYGQQPYCGYSNHEVLEMISRRQLLTCPDQCPAKIYSLMQECWSAQPAERPQFKDIHAKLVGWEGTSTARMTSQLAQGIHRQLNNVMKGGNTNGQFVQYGPQHRIGEESRYTSFPYSGMAPVVPGGPNSRESASSSFGGTPAPAYNYALQLQPPTHHPPSRQGGYPHPVFSNYSSPPSRSSGSVTSSEFTHHQPLRVNNLTSHQELPETLDSNRTPPQSSYPAGPERRSRPSLENRSNPDKPLPGMYSNTQVQGEINEAQPGQRNSRPNSRMRPDGDLPLTVYQDRDHESENDNYSPTRGRPALAPKPPSYYSTVQGDRTRSADRQLRNGVDGNGSGNNADTNAKARSFDSGLPCDDVDSEGASSRMPLLPSNSSHPSQRSPKHLSVLPSTSSSVSGATQITVDTRVS